MTDRIYYVDAYQKQFDATATATRKDADGVWIALDRSAFYPTGGGQPHDTGTLRFLERAVQVTDVLADEENTIWHRVTTPIEKGTAVRGEIDWVRRWDHMQQHGGEHILAGSIWHLFQGITRGLHLGKESSTIDVKMPFGRLHLTQEERKQLEDLANERIMSDAPIRCWFPSQDELRTLPLRKEATVDHHVRVVAAGDFEMVPCGGTHPSSTGQLGMIKIVEIAPSRGSMRIQFVAGMRALQFFQTCMDAVHLSGAQLSASAVTLPQAVKKMMDANDALKKENTALKAEKAQVLAAELIAGAEPLQGGDILIKAVLPDADMNTLRDIALHAVKQSRVIVLLAAPSPDGTLVTFARAQDAKGDMALLLRQSGTKGGGRADFARGKAGDPDILDVAAASLKQ
ncbi:MAG: DHHA1 domain-containing protein [Eubacteriales bacterium]|nr:DHHA1 domain-containing protein [Eubacteriales bacterium]